jgi:PhnB protein
MSEVHKYSPVSVYLMADDGNAALEFYWTAFAAEVTETYPYEGRLGHATLKINGTTCTVSLTVDDADAWFNRALTAGAEVVRPLNDEFYGRSGKVGDPFGHTWGIVGPAKTSKN